MSCIEAGWYWEWAKSVHKQNNYRSQTQFLRTLCAKNRKWMLLQRKILVQTIRMEIFNWTWIHPLFSIYMPIVIWWWLFDFFTKFLFSDIYWYMHISSILTKQLKSELNDLELFISVICHIWDVTFAPIENFLSLILLKI